MNLTVPCPEAIINKENYCTECHFPRLQFNSATVDTWVCIFDMSGTALPNLSYFVVGLIIESHYFS